ncbi:hypothetical protein B0H14DRAFT_3689905 [Mycena olivaceomarginata]|nr:hypothetical protein B0H14DRAFT_3689905 [Mycena olivaceomarginata]
MSLYGSWPCPRDQAPADSESTGRVFGVDGGSNMVTMAGREEGGGRMTKGTDPMSCGHEAHQESPEVGSGSRIRIRGSAKDADTLDGTDRPDGLDVERTEVVQMGWTESSNGPDARGKGGRPDRLRKDIEQTEVDQMGWAGNRRMVWLNWSQGLSDGLEVREKGPDPRFSRGHRRMWKTQQIVQSRRVHRSQVGTAEVGRPLTNIQDKFKAAYHSRKLMQNVR